jgi:steroid delta-isomerase
VQDPIGPSPFDPEGKGHHGREALTAFYDTVIAPSDAVTFEIERSYRCGPEVADVGIIRTTLAGGTHQARVHGVYTCRSNGAGKLASLRAFWEFDALELAELVELGG